MDLKSLKHWLFRQPKPNIAISFSDHGLHIVCSDEDGHITQMLSIPRSVAVEGLRDLVKKHSLQKKPCICILSKSDYQAFLLEKPQVSTTEMIPAIKWRIADSLDFALESSVVDYIELPTKKGATEMIYVVVAKKSVVESTISLVKQALLIPCLVDIPEMSQAHILQKEGGRCKALLSIHTDIAHIQIYKNGKLLFMRHIDLNLPDKSQNAFVQALALQIQRSLDYCSSNLVDTQNTIILLDGEADAQKWMGPLSEVLGLQVKSLSFETMPDLPTIVNYDMLSALGGVMRRE